MTALHQALACRHIPDSPKGELWCFQGHRCAGCGREVELDAARVSRDLYGSRIEGVVCKRCSISTPIPFPAPVLVVPDLLRLRLTQGPRPVFPSAPDPALVQAARSGNYRYFTHPYEALWYFQGGCPIENPVYNPHTSPRGSVDCEADTETDLILGVICKPCRSTQGSKWQHRLENEWDRYLDNPPGLRFPVTAGLSRSFVRNWDTTRWRQSGRRL